MDRPKENDDHASKQKLHVAFVFVVSLMLEFFLGLLGHAANSRTSLPIPIVPGVPNGYSIRVGQARLSK
jgi:hypothetical protein